MIWRPTPVDPVKLTARTAGWWSRAAVISREGPWTRLTTPAGNPASCRTSNRPVAASGAFSDTLPTTVQPAASIAASLRAWMETGKFHGREAEGHADGFAEAEVAPAVEFGRADGAGGAADFLGEPAEVFNREVHFPLGFGEPFSGFQRQGVGQFVAAFGQEVRGVAEQVCPVAGRGPGPGTEGFGRGVGGRGGVVRGAPGHFADGAAVSGVGDVLGAAGGVPGSIHQVSG